MFYLSRLVVEICSPFITALILQVFGVIFILFNRKKIGVISSICSIAIVLIFGYGSFAQNHIKQNERAFRPIYGDVLSQADLAAVRYIAVLGSGHVSDHDLPANSQIGGASLYRIVEAKRLTKIVPQAEVIVLGGIGYDPVPNARVVENVALILDIPAEKIVTRDEPRNTEQEAQILSEIVGSAPFLLVTSANHMARAVSICRKTGLNPIPSPTDYIIKNHTIRPAAAILPSLDNLALTRSVVYESAGSLWIRTKELFRKFL